MKSARTLVAKNNRWLHHLGRLVIFSLVSLLIISCLLFFAALCESVCVDGAHAWDPLGQTIELTDELDPLEIFVCLISYGLFLLSMKSFFFAMQQLELSFVCFCPCDNFLNRLLS